MSPKERKVKIETLELKKLVLTAQSARAQKNHDFKKVMEINNELVATDQEIRRLKTDADL